MRGAHDLAVCAAHKPSETRCHEKKATENRSNDRLSGGAVMGSTSSSFRATSNVVLVQHFFHFVHELRRKEWFFQNVCHVLAQVMQFAEFGGKACNEQELHVGASRTNLLHHLKAVELGHDDITHCKVDFATVLLAQAECLRTIGGRKNGKS